MRRGRFSVCMIMMSMTVMKLLLLLLLLMMTMMMTTKTTMTTIATTTSISVEANSQPAMVTADTFLLGGKEPESETRCERYTGATRGSTQLIIIIKVNIVLNVHRNHEAY